jgi:pilus assembly protein CpaE
MIAELSAMHRTTKIFLQMARVLTGHGEDKKPQRSLLSPIMRMFQDKLSPGPAARASAR